MSHDDNTGRVSRVTCNKPDPGSRSPTPDSRFQVSGPSDEINLLAYWHIIWKYRKMISAILLAASITAVVISLTLPKTYRAEAVIIPISSKGGGSLGALASQFGGLASLAGVSLSGGGADDATKFVAILESRTLAESVINHENLMPIFFEDLWDKEKGAWKVDDPEKLPNMEGAVRRMKGAVAVSSDRKTKVIKIHALFSDPEMSAQVANAYVTELQNFINASALTAAKRNRIFIEGQLAENKRGLLEAGKEINDFYKAKSISSVESNVDVDIGISPAMDTTLEGKPRFAARNMQNDPVLRNLLAEKLQVERKIAEARTVKDVPQQVYLTYLMLRRELLAKVNALLTTQYEMAKIKESREDLAFQVIDRAVPPVIRASPKRAQLCIMSFVAALFAAVFLAFFVEYIKKINSARDLIK